LLIAVSEEQSEDLLSKIKKSCAEARIVGRVMELGKHGIRIV
jgi:hydrogenase maturation factor